MSEKDVETNEGLLAAPEEAAPAEKDEQSQETCADLAQTTADTGTQIPLLRSPETPGLTDSPTTSHDGAEVLLRPETEEGEDEATLRAASLRAQSSSPEFQSVGSTPSPERTPMTDVHPGCEEDDPVDTSSPARDDNVYVTPTATPPPVLEGEDGSRTPPGASFPPDEPQLRVSPKRKVENMDQGLDSSAELPMSQKKARAGSDCGSADEEEHQWDTIPPPQFSDRRLAGRLPWGGGVSMVLGGPLLENRRPRDPSPETHPQRAKQMDSSALLRMGSRFMETQPPAKSNWRELKVYAALSQT